jgi:hypothetical protein
LLAGVNRHDAAFRHGRVATASGMANVLDVLRIASVELKASAFRAYSDRYLAVEFELHSI